MEELFNLVKNYGYIVRTNNLNGLSSWNEMKTLLLQFRCEELTWDINLKNLDEERITSLEDAYNYVHRVLGMLGDETDCKDENWEKFHFFLQLVRIPFKNPICDLVRLAQIAYNLGQLNATYYDSVYTEVVKRFYTINNLSEMRTYINSSDGCVISEENLEKIRCLIDSKTIGSGYLHKYKKYKKKYLQIKNKL